jgi:hypothetical protein
MIIPDLDAEKLETVGDIINYLAGAKDWIGGGSMMEYKGYFSKVEFDDDANIFYGVVM